ncbi:hypothetical protein FB45DRAFT_888911 [Roridomyces roridus]|uniref:Uncharacterized protein n=1 Tax=Roridomyces roridus TaxID=1738132 RepID=A0AAD7FZ60_9AGAR|nr:hypothetical protein FB45DRAFT_888911 [Roridomyces roridus]
MSVCVQLQVDLIPPHRKRTTSFSCAARPRKRLHRTESVIDLATLAAEQLQQPQPLPVQVPYNRSLRFYKEQKDRRRTLVRAELSPPPLPATPLAPPPIHHRKTQLPAARSPLARNTDSPNPSPPPPRALLLVPAAARARTTCGTGVPPGSSRPSSSSSSSRRSSPPSSCLSLPSTSQPPPKATKSKRTAPQTLHRRAVLASLRATPHGAKILHMGARLAVGILGATAELERLCAGSESEDEEEEEEVMHEGESDEDAEGEVDEELLLESIMDAEPDFYSYSSSEEEAEPDVPMPDAELEAPPVLSASWVVLGDSQPEPLTPSRIRPAEHEWEMVE